MVKLLNILPTSYFEYVSPKVPVTKEALDRARETYKENKPSSDTLAALGVPANQNSPYRNLSTRNDSLHHPVSNVIQAPDGATGGLVVLNDSAYPKIDNRTISMRLMSEMVAYKNVSGYLENNGFEQFQEVSGY